MLQMPTFLTAEWRNLVMLNYPAERAVLQPLVPPGTELDTFHGEAFLSVVGFQFLRTRVLGVSFPRHTNFEEVNLRFYVRRKSSAGWRRGVVFVRELVPRWAIAFIARTCYGEPYSALPMRHRIDVSDGIRAEYGWWREGRWESVYARGTGEPKAIEPGSEEEFITEHYWGYTARPGGCSEFQVEHPPWRVWQASETGFDAQVAGLYGQPFVASLAAGPSSAFIAEGSPIAVRRKAALHADVRPEVGPTART